VANTAEGVRVVIYDQEYFIRGQLDPEYIQKLGNYLDAKMRSIAGRTRNVDSLRVAVLAGLNIADEHHQLKAKYETVSQKVGACDQVLDEILRIAG
jgi:cell division protein ZapA